jgi:CrcB protein
VALPWSGPHGFPWATLLVNVVGAALVGFLAAVPVMRLPLTSRMRAMIGIGFCGGLTTFSTMSVQIGMQTSTLWGVGVDPFVGIAYTVVSIIGAVLSVLAGWRIGQRVFSE